MPASTHDVMPFEVLYCNLPLRESCMDSNAPAWACFYVEESVACRHCRLQVGPRSHHHQCKLLGPHCDVTGYHGAYQHSLVHGQHGQAALGGQRQKRHCSCPPALSFISTSGSRISQRCLTSRHTRTFYVPELVLVLPKLLWQM